MTIRSNRPYTPNFLKAAGAEGKPLQMSYSDFEMSDTNHESIDSFKYDPLGYPLKSTQQLSIDWSKFENHTFFSSAEVKVNDAFNRIVNGYPFDGSKKEVEAFLDSLTGFEKWVFDSFPRWSGALHFSGTLVGEVPSSTRGNWISVKDKSGNMFPSLAKNKKGEVVINPSDDASMSVEMMLKLPQQTNDTQVVFQKSSGQNMGFTFHLQPASSTSTVTAVFSVASGSVKNSVSATLTKGSYNHLCLTLNKEDAREDQLQFFVNEELVATSAVNNKIRKLDIDEANLLIGSGSSFYNLNSLITPTQTLSGTIDEFRLFHSVRDVKTQKLHASRGLYATPDLKLYFRFNEPSGSLSLNSNSSVDSIVLDSSGNSLHANVNNFNNNLRIDASLDDTALTNENGNFKIVLFPAYQEVVDLNEELLVTASNYDRANPNIILKLIPRHYLLEGAAQDGFANVEGDAGNPYDGKGIPGQGKKGSVQIILSFLYIWAKFFDELKTYIDSFVTLRTVSYQEEDSMPDNFLEDLVNFYGFYMPKFFNHASTNQFAEGERIDGVTDIGTPLKKIQAAILRRTLVNMPDIMRSKGTQHSIKSFLRSIGIDPDNSLRIREYGGSTTRQLTTAREKRIEPGAMVQFTGSSFVISTPLSASRIEPGFPAPAGTFQKNSFDKIIGTNKLSDGLLTSGSWNLEGVFKIPPQTITEITDDDGNQSLIRMIVTGSSATAGPGLVLNVVATQFVDHPEESATVQAFIRPGLSNSSPLLKLSLPINGKGIFDGEKWNVSVGCMRNDEFDSITSSSYYLRVAKNDAGEINEVYVTSSYFLEQVSSEGNAFRSGSTQFNVSGTYICMGSGQTIPTLSSYYFLNDTLNVPDIARTLEYVGWASNVKFWSKSMSEDEWREHARNPKSFGVDNPLINYNFVDNLTGSFQRLRLDSLIKQPERNADSSGDIEFLDFSQNNRTMQGSGFTSGSKVLIGELFNYSYLSPMFDEAATDDKVRIRSFFDANLVKENPGSVDAPSYSSNDMFTQEEPQDDLRLSIEFSMVDSLDKDMASMFSSFDILNNFLGSPELMFSPDYPDLENLRDVYFNRLSGKPDFRKFLEFYRWFDTSISSFIEQLIPSKTLYKGSNFVIESHMLERHKNMYRHSGNYLGERQTIEDGLLVQQIVGKLKKY